MAKYKVKSNLSSYSSNLSLKAHVSETDVFNPSRYPGLKLIRLENDKSCLKYLCKSFKKQRLKEEFSNLKNIHSSESDSSNSCQIVYDISDDSSSCDQLHDRSDEIRLSDKFFETERSVENNWNLSRTSNELLKQSGLDSKSLKFPIIKLIRLENDENCYKYLNQNSETKMLEIKKTDSKKLSPIVIVTNPNVHGKHKNSFMIKKRIDSDAISESSSEVSQDSYGSKSGCGDNNCLQIVNNNPEKIIRCNTYPNSCHESNSTALDTSESLSLSTLHLNGTKYSKLNMSFQNNNSSILDINLTPGKKCSGEISQEKPPEKLVKMIHSEPRKLSIVEQIISDFSEDSLDEKCFESQSESTTAISNSNLSNSQCKTSHDTILRDIPDECTSNCSSDSKNNFTGCTNDSTMTENSDECENEMSPNKNLTESDFYVIDLQFISDDLFERMVADEDPSDPNLVEATCELCDASFTSRSSLLDHLVEHHDCNNIFECDHCGKVYDSKACLVFHLYARIVNQSKLLSSSHICPHYSCSKEDFTNSELEFLLHICSNHKELHKQQSLPNVSAPNLNVVSCSSDEKMCIGSCDESVKPIIPDVESNQSGKQSLRIKFDGRKKSSVVQSSKLIDKNSFVRKKRSKFKVKHKNDHIQNLSIKHECHICNENLQNRKELFNHLYENHRHLYYYECHICAKLFQNSIAFASHFIDKECLNFEISNKKVLKYTCEICHNSYKNKEILRKHKMNLHQLYTPVPKNGFIQSLFEFEIQNSSFTCYCYENYSNWTELINHEQNTHNIFSCFGPKCSEKFYSLVNLERHMFCHFSVSDSSFCDFCSQLFFTKQYLEAHIKNHLKELYS